MPASFWSLNRRHLISRAFELVRFAATGTVAALLNIVIVMFLTERLGLHYLVSLTICFITVTFCGFWANRIWTFRKRSSGAATDLTRYVIAALAQLCLSLALLGLCVEVLHIPYPSAMLLLSAAFVPITYLLHRRWSFGLRWVNQHEKAGAYEE
jgi:putative flippase GtrA